MINVQKVKKGLGKCWKFFAAKPAYAATAYYCAYCGYHAGNLYVIRKCPVTGGNCVWVPREV